MLPAAAGNRCRIHNAWHLACPPAGFDVGKALSALHGASLLLSAAGRQRFVQQFLGIKVDVELVACGQRFLDIVYALLELGFVARKLQVANDAIELRLISVSPKAPLQGRG